MLFPLKIEISAEYILLLLRDTTVRLIGSPVHSSVMIMPIPYEPPEPPLLEALLEALACVPLIAEWTKFSIVIVDPESVHIIPLSVKDEPLYKVVVCTIIEYKKRTILA